MKMMRSKSHYGSCVVPMIVAILITMLLLLFFFYDDDDDNDNDDDNDDNDNCGNGGGSVGCSSGDNYFNTEDYLYNNYNLKKCCTNLV